MTAEVDIMQRWGFLEPWFCMLRIQRMDRRQHSPFEPDQLNAHISLPAAQDEVQMTLEGLKLLAAVAHVDYGAWKKILVGHSGMTGDRWVKDTDNGSTVRFQLRIEKNDGTVDKIVQMCGVRQHDHPRREYSEALGRIAAMDAKRDSKRRGVEIPVPLVLSFWTDISPVKLRDAERTCEWKSRSLPPVEPGGLRCCSGFMYNTWLTHWA
ncbi:hypothetical protein DVH05_004571 [Phytophthora capsici]|nr:hypothetical protein DVH05_004571 [Phytophthora capsici]